MKEGRDGSPSRPHTAGSPGAFGESALPNQNSLRQGIPCRKLLSHQIPSWVSENPTFFITINCVPRGKNQLASFPIADALKESIAARIALGHWWPRLILLMPDHLHGLIVFNPEKTMERIVRNWKRYAAANFHIVWQRDFFDHRIRNEESLEEKWQYILHNPVRAGLVSSPEEWPFVWTSETWATDFSLPPKHSHR